MATTIPLPPSAQQILNEAPTIHTLYQQHLAAQQHALSNQAATMWTSAPTAAATEHTPTQLVSDTLDDILFGIGEAVAPSIKKVMKRPTSVQPSGKLLLQDVYKYPALKLDKVRSNAFEKSNKFDGEPFKWCMPNALVGIEVEVENITGPVPMEAYWQSKPDNSLRNNGVEFVSIPLAVAQIQPALHHLYQQMARNNKPDFSNRTSIHVHLNVRDMTQDQIYTLFLLYCIFEKHFYKFVGTKRLNSIFCVPIYRSNLDQKAVRTIYHLEASWQKYCGLNLLPLVSNGLNPGGYGTIEFRHLYGTDNYTTVMHWINNILALRKAAMSIPKDEVIALIKEMNTTSGYRSLYAQVFPEEYRILESKNDFEECVSNIKRELFGNDYINTIKVHPDSLYWVMASKLGLRG